MNKYVLDSFAILTLLEDEAGAAELGSLLEDNRNSFWMSTVNLGEVYYIVARERGEPSAVQVLQDVQAQDNVTIVDATWDRVLQAAKFKATGGMSYADGFACGLAAEYGAPVLSGDPKLRAVEGIKVVWPTP